VTPAFQEPRPCGPHAAKINDASATRLGSRKFIGAAILSFATRLLVPDELQLRDCFHTTNDDERYIG